MALLLLTGIFGCERVVSYVLFVGVVLWCTVKVRNRESNYTRADSRWGERKSGLIWKRQRTIGLHTSEGWARSDLATAVPIAAAGPGLYSKGMASPRDGKGFIFTLARRLLARLSLDWLVVAGDVAHYLRRFPCLRPKGLYEILDYEATLELLDTTGKRARFKKRQRVKFLQDNVIAFEDCAWGDGDVLVNYKCTPGVVADRYRESDRWNVLISLRETRNRGDIEEFHIERTVKNSYVRDEEWLQTEIRRSTRRLSMGVIFPKQRTCRRAALMQRSANRVLVLGPNHFHALPDGRQLVTWETDHVRAFEVYTLQWRW